MIPTIKGNIDKQQDVDIVLFSHGVFDFNHHESRVFAPGASVQNTEELPSLQNLHMLKCGMLNSFPNNRIESATELLRDLSLLLPGVTNSILLVDISTLNQGRNVFELHKIARDTNEVQTAFVTSVSNPGYEDETTFGIKIEDESGNLRVFPAACVIDNYNCKEYDDINTFQKKLKIPILLDAQAFGSLSNVLYELLKYTEEQNVCVFNFTLCTENLSYVIEILEKTSAHVCINCLGRGCVYSPLEGAMPFNDEQILDFLCGLSQDVLETRIILSVNIDAKCHWKSDTTLR